MSIELVISEVREVISLQIDEQSEQVSLTIEQAPAEVELTIIEQGSISIEGESNIISATAAAVMSSGVAVVMSDGQLVAFDPLQPGHAGRIVGFAIHSAAAGQPLAVRVAGIMQNDGYAFTPGHVVFATAAGISTIAPASGTLAPVGRAIAPDKFIINFLTPINRT